MSAIAKRSTAQWTPGNQSATNVLDIGSAERISTARLIYPAGEDAINGRRFKDSLR